MRRMLNRIKLGHLDYLDRLVHLDYLDNLVHLARLAPIALLLLLLAACIREPELHLYRGARPVMEMPMVDLDLDVYWNYEIGYGIVYDWRAEWYYGWDEQDIYNHRGPIGYTEPKVFNLRRYYTGDVPYAHHTIAPPADPPITGYHFQGEYDWGFWDILVWNETESSDGIVSLNFDEKTSLDSVTAYTNPTMVASRYNAPKFTRAFYEPEGLFSAYDRAMEINRDLDGFEYDPERNVWVKQLRMRLNPITYIYLLQVILHNNKGRITEALGPGMISGFARSTNVNTGRGGSDAISLSYQARMKKNIPLVGYYPDKPEESTPTTEYADVIGSRIMTFGICDIIANSVKDASEVHDAHRHYLDVDVQFYNGMDSTIVFDITDQVRSRYKGGVITVELDVDTVPIPKRRGGSGFNAVVKDFEDGGTHEFEM